MTRARKIKIKLARSTPRNPVVAALATGKGTGKAGAHRKQAASERQAAKKALQKELARLKV